MIYLLIGALLFIQAKSQLCDSNANCTDPLYAVCDLSLGAPGSCIQCSSNSDCEMRQGEETICEWGYCYNATITTTMYESTSSECTFGWIQGFYIECSLYDYVCDGGECVVCRDGTDCQNSQSYGVPAGFGSTCGLYEGIGPLCQKSCSDDNDCPLYLTKFCDTEGVYPGQCVQCNEDFDCYGDFGTDSKCNSQAVCYVPTTTEGPTTTEFICNNDTECSDPTPYCMYGECSECKNDTSCGDGYLCEPASYGYECVIKPTTTEPPIDCTLNEECPAENPICMDFDYVCGQCNDDADCGSGYQCRWGGYNSPGTIRVSYCEPEPTTPADQVIGNVTCGDIVEGTLDSDNPAEYYRLTLDDIYDVVISTCNDGYFPTLTDTKLFLYDATGETEIYDDDDGGCGALSEIAEKLYARDYIIGVERFNSNYDGTYSLSITCSIPEPTTTEEMTTTTEAPINVSMVMDGIECGSLVNGSISFNDQVDYYYLMLNETTVVNVTTCTGYGDDLDLLDDTVLHIYDEWGIRLHENDNSGPCFQKSTIVEELDEGKYVIGVSSYDPFLSGDYYLLATCSEPEPEFPDSCTKNEDCEDDEQCTPVSILGQISKFCISPGIEICSTNEDCLPGYGCNFPDPQVPIGGCFIEEQSGPCTVDGDDCDDGLTCFDASSLPIDNFCYLLCEDPVTDCGSDDYICASNSDDYDAVVTTCFYAKEYTDDPTPEPTLEPTEDPTMEPTEVTGAPSAAPTAATPAPVEDEPISTLADGVEELAVFGGMIIMIIHALFM